VRHYDVKTAFLNGDIDEELYMKQPEGFVKPGEQGKVCKIQKALYGLKQSARSWNHKIDSVLKTNGFTQGKADLCLYVTKYNGECLYILLYIDDLLICGDAQAIKNTENILSEYFEIKDLGEVSLYLGIQVEKDIYGNFLLSQTNKIRQIVSEFGLTDANGCSTPMNTDYLSITSDENILDSNE